MEAETIIIEHVKYCTNMYVNYFVDFSRNS